MRGGSARKQRIALCCGHCEVLRAHLENRRSTGVHSTTTRSSLFRLELFSKILGFSCKQRITASILVFRIQKQKSEFWSRQRRAIHKWAVFVGRSACRHWQHADTSAQIEGWLSMALWVFNLAWQFNIRKTSWQRSRYSAKCSKVPNETTEPNWIVKSTSDVTSG